MECVVGRVGGLSPSHANRHETTVHTYRYTIVQATRKGNTFGSWAYATKEPLVHGVNFFPVEAAVGLLLCEQ